MPLIPENVIDEIQARVDLAELIGRYVPLKRAGRHFKAHCPFHKEKTPSFMVNTDKQIFHCFGCGVGGNIFSFLMQHDRLTFPEAVRQLAEHVGVRIPEREPAATDDAYKRLAALMEKVCRYFERTLQSPQGSAARAYVKERGVSDAACGAFRLGAAPAGWDHLLKSAAAAGVSRDQLEGAGLVVKGPSSVYDRFRNRLIFPIVDLRGRVVGFGGRSLDGKEPKYLNSPDTALYRKGQHLFGLAQAKDAVIAKNTAIVVEGYFDCVVLADAGITHVVSPLGTALTTDHARLLARYAERVILAFDPDAAGEQATLRGIDLLVEAGLRVEIAQLPQGVDPDECVRSSGRERFERLLEQSAGIFEFLVQTAVQRHPLTSVEDKVNAAQFILPTIAKVPDAMLRSEYVRLLAERLHVDEGAVAQELSKVQPRPHTNWLGIQRAPIGVGARPFTQGPEPLLTAMILDEPARWRQAQDQVSCDDITEPTLRRVLAIVSELERSGESATTAQLVSRLSEEGLHDVVGTLMALVESLSSPDEVFADCLRRLRARAQQREREQKREQLRAAQEAGHEAEVHRLLAEFQELLSQPKGG